MYCSNCGLKLPDWANYCERCGARVRHAKASDDPLDRVGAADTSASEPLWTDEPGQEAQDIPAQAPADAFGMETQFVSAQTMRMDMAEVFDGLEVETGAPAGAEEQLVESEAAEEPAPAEEPLEPALGPDATQRVAPEHMAEVAREELELAQEQEEDETEGASDEADEAEGASDVADAAPAQEPPAPREEAAPQADEVYGRPERIDVGDMDGMLPLDSSIHHHGAEPWQGRQRPSARRSADAPVSVKALGIAAAAAIVLGFAAAFFLLGGKGASEPGEEAPTVLMERVSSREASAVISRLNGWWTTDRTLDGRYWHLQDGLMETYAADGQLARQVLVDPTSVSRMTAGPGGIEGAGYYLRDIAFYLLDSDEDTLYAISGDGSADESGNLFRSQMPAFMSSGKKSTKAEPTMEEEKVDESEYLLPESSTRVYDSSELEPLSDHDLFVARNEIYARHGYKFEVGELSEYFASKSWYHPSDVFNEGEITDIERQNVSAILALEQSRGSRYV